ncbi:tRNA sulfurtransferase [Candidatus Lokiarchaeum ossiferum]|uniref:tRNA sulfurtransferase n=1 Tax=Candidatus Lokiarchaeum ossiferum TaxID=2951803 RepID=A0ABY6HSP9_9ARCH|nr:tRNA sulfurtransferase [Candidatus Lokiarchaeum sp. B-35]
MLSETDFLDISPSFVSLLSTGLDSPIASYLIMKQGYNCFGLSFLNGKENRNLNKEKIIQIGKKLVELTKRKMRLHFVDYDAIVEVFKEKCEPKLTCVICKRTMIHTAVYLTHFYKASMIVNGDILGEQASQTLDNLYAVHQINKEVPVVRPLIGFDKLDIIKISQKVGLYELSLIKGPACENNPKHPETRANVQKLLVAESNIDRDEILKNILSLIEFIDIEPEN